MLAWGAPRFPGLALAAARACSPQANRLRSRSILAAREVYELALSEALLPGWEEPSVAPVETAQDSDSTRARALRRRYVASANVAYGPDPAQRLDVWRLPGLGVESSAPVLIFLPGGAWVHGSKRGQGYHLLAHLTREGWVCFAAGYRVAPQHPWPAHIHDVKRVVAWARAHVAEYGGDPRFVALAGCSAGGHLAMLAGLTADDPALEAHLPGGSTSVDAVVSLYGRYDWEDRLGPERAEFMDFLEQVVVGRLQRTDPEVFRAASPMARTHPGAPPVFVIHGVADSIIPVAQARAFVTALRAVSRSTVAYAELPGAQHGFDLLSNRRTADTARAVERFLRSVRQQHAAG